MSRIHANMERKEFTMPPSVEQKTVCSISGMLAIPGSCPGITEYFATDILPTERCTGHGDTYDEDTEEETEEDEDEDGNENEYPIEDPSDTNTNVPDPGPSTPPDIPTPPSPSIPDPPADTNPDPTIP